LADDGGWQRKTASSTGAVIAAGDQTGSSKQGSRAWQGDPLRHQGRIQSRGSPIRSLGSKGDHQQLVAAAQPSLTDFHKQALSPIPPVKGASSMDLASIVGASGTREIGQLGAIRFQALSDSGVNHATEGEQVAEDMTTDFKAD